MNTENIKNIINDDDFKEVVSGLRTRYINNFVNSEDYDADQRETAYRNLKVLDELVSELESIAITGEIKAKALKIL